MEDNHGFKKNDPGFATRAIHEGNEPERWKSLAVVPAISMSTTFKQYNPGNPEVNLILKCLHIVSIYAN